jgi:hypothetical protein
MRTRSIVAILVVLELLVAALLWIWAVRQTGRPRPAISIGVLAYEPWAGKGPSLLVRVGITNTGCRTITYNQINFDGDAWVRTESPSGWTTRDNGPFALLPLLPELLRPGSTTIVLIYLPEGTLRWQVGFKVRTASLSERVNRRIPAKWYRRLHPLCERYLSNKEQEQDVQSGVFECPHNQQHSADGSQPFRSVAIRASAAAGSHR